MPTINKTKAWLFGLTLVIAVCIIYETSSRSQTVTTQNVPIQRIQSNISHRQELALFWNEADYKKRLPKCIIVGVRKAGTRALKDFLSIHPRIVVAKREQHFFGLPLKYRKGMFYFHRFILNTLRLKFNIEIISLILAEEPISFSLAFWQDSCTMS